MLRTEKGTYCDTVTSADSRVIIKTSRDTYPASEARIIRQQLLDYAYSLTVSPLKTARFLGAHVLESAVRDRFVVRHSQEKIKGTQLDQLPYAERMSQTAAVIAAILHSPTRPRRPDLLAVPLDAKPANFIVTPRGEPVLVDIYPPLYWDMSDQVRYGGQTTMSDQDKESANEYYGNRIGVVARMAALSIDLDIDHAREAQMHDATQNRRWYDELLPGGLSDLERTNVRERTHELLVLAHSVA